MCVGGGGGGGAGGVDGPLPPPFLHPAPFLPPPYLPLHPPRTLPAPFLPPPCLPLPPPRTLPSYTLHPSCTLPACPCTLPSFTLPPGPSSPCAGWAAAVEPVREPPSRGCALLRLRRQRAVAAGRLADVTLGHRGERGGEEGRGANVGGGGFRAVMDHQGSSSLGCLGPSWIIMDHHGSSWIIKLGVSAIMDHQHHGY